ncbi:hypothetical protein [Streptacidiphilus sp. EB103A]|uniref:hypothetical protein n=1 Tax=Streptacidiphilus sp. EB103A TaxID=3156275 RepID=UPI003518AA40
MLLPDNCTRLRWRTAGGFQHTQEWVPDDDPEAPNAGEWITWRYVVDPEPTPVGVDDLDRCAAALVAGHFPTNMLRTSPDDGVQEECACGQWYPSGRQNVHLGRVVSQLARSLFDLGQCHAPPAASTAAADDSPNTEPAD